MRCKFQVKRYTYFFRAELSRLLGEKNPCCIVGLEPGTSWFAVRS